jgi:hypothetical protein
MMADMEGVADMRGMADVKQGWCRHFQLLLLAAGLVVILALFLGCTDKRALPVAPHKTPFYMITGLV